ncbi:MAG: ABC transporter permease [Peptostreptococcaceae bacterium]|nr:ABC transporter permease [Peptostreptococcaceae bacterium]
MLVRLIQAEQMKLRRSPMWIVCIVLPIFSAFLGTANYLGNIGILKKEWYSLWTQHTLFVSYFILPVMLGVFCSYLMRLEHNNHNWNKMLSLPVSRKLIFVAKLASVTKLILLTQLWIAVLFVISGKIAGLTEPPPIHLMFMWGAFGTLGGMVTASIQLLLSAYIKSFALPIGISFIGGISGIIALVKGFGHLWPYALMSYGMSSNAPQQITQGNYSFFVILCILYIVLLVFVANRLMSRKSF